MSVAGQSAFGDVGGLAGDRLRLQSGQLVLDRHRQTADAFSDLLGLRVGEIQAEVAQAFARISVAAE